MPPTATPTPTLPPIRPICLPPVITLFQAPATAELGEHVPFDIGISSTCFSHWTVNFGDGSTSLVGLQPSTTTEHAFFDCGIQRVELVAEDTLGQTMTAFVDVDVMCPPTPTPTPGQIETKCCIDDEVGWTLECVVLPAQIPDGATVRSAYLVTEQSDYVMFWIRPASYRGFTVKYQTVTTISPEGWFDPHPPMPEFSMSATQSTLEPFSVEGSNDIQVSEIAAHTPFITEVNQNKLHNRETVITLKTSRLTSARNIRASKLDPLTSAMCVTVMLEL